MQLDIGLPAAEDRNELMLFLSTDAHAFTHTLQPQGGSFSYTEAEFVNALDGLLVALGVTGQVQLVTSGFLPGSYGLSWALQNAARVKRVVILNGPLTSATALPGPLAALRVPFLGEFAAQVRGGKGGALGARCRGLARGGAANEHHTSSISIRRVFPGCPDRGTLCGWRLALLPRL